MSSTRHKVSKSWHPLWRVLDTRMNTFRISLIIPNNLPLLSFLCVSLLILMVKKKFDKTSPSQNTVFSHVMFWWSGGERGKGTTNAGEKKKGTKKVRRQTSSSQNTVFISVEPQQVQWCCIPIFLTLCRQPLLPSHAPNVQYPTSCSPHFPFWFFDFFLKKSHVTRPKNKDTSHAPNVQYRTQTAASLDRSRV